MTFSPGEDSSYIYSIHMNKRCKMALAKELGLSKPITVPEHEALLNIYYTASCVKKRATVFFRSFGLTDVQFNLMMLLTHQAKARGGLTQVQLSQMMLVNRANITSLIDRMEKSKLVARTSIQSDRRYNVIKLTGRGRRLLSRVEKAYIEEVIEIMGALKGPELRTLVDLLDRTRQKLRGRRDL